MHGNTKHAQSIKALRKEAGKKAAQFNKKMAEVTKFCSYGGEDITNLKKVKNHK